MEWDNFFKQYVRKESGGDKAFVKTWDDYVKHHEKMSALEKSLAATYGDTPEANIISRMVRGKDYMPVQTKLPKVPLPD